MRHYRYPGPRPFSEDFGNVFFGREKEINELTRLVRREPWLVLYGRSGLGKSSLLNAGVAPRLTGEDGMSPVFIRFHAWTAGRKDGPLGIAAETLEGTVKNNPAWLEQLVPNDKSLWRILKNRQLNGGKQGPVLLIFDQFEELFTFPQKNVEAFAKSLAEIFYTEIPERYRQALEKASESNYFMFGEKELQGLHEPLPLRVITAIRTDRMALMHQLKPFLPNTLDLCYGLLPLSRTAAEEAVLSPAFDPGKFLTPRFDFEDKALDSLLDFLSSGESQDIESFQLQILCEHLEKQVVERKGHARISEEDLSNPESILENYYMGKIEDIKDPEARLAARKLMEEGLIFEEEERRLTLFEGQIAKVWGVDTELLAQLEETHLVRREPSLRGGYTYELSHDTLVAPMLKAKRVRLTEEKQKVEKLALEEIERKVREAEARALEEHRKAEEAHRMRKRAESEKKRARIMMYLAIGMSALAIGAALFAVELFKRAEVQKLEIQAAKEESDDRLQAFLNAQALKDMLEIEKLEQRGDELVETENFEPAMDLYQSARKIAEGNPSRPQMTSILDRLNQKIETLNDN